MDLPYRILLVEDSRTQAVRLRVLLEREGWEVLWASSGEEAIERIGSFTPDLILVDFYLPGIRGDELCRQVRMRIDTRIIAVIMLTVSAASEIEERALESGADDFVRKSDDPERLLLRVRTMLKRSRSQRSILSPSESCFRRARLLAVDDSPTYLAYLARELSTEAYQIESAPNGVEALKRLDAEEFDCVLVDMVMPEMDGIATCRRIDDLRREGRIRAMTLMLTGQDDKEGLTRALEAGADDFVNKSGDLAVLKVRIRALLRRKFYEEENQRILAELKDKQLQVERAQIEKEAAEARASLVERLDLITSELHGASAELEKFAYVASHDLQEPLRLVASYLQLLERRYGEQLDDDAKEFIGYAVEGAKRMKRLIQDLLNYTRVETRAGAMEPCDCEAALAGALATLGPLLEGAGAQVSRDPMPTLPADRNQVAQLLEHLLANAVKFRSDQPLRIHVGAREEARQWVFSVRDNGIGLDPSCADRVFIIFQRLHGPEVYPGTGVGLAICRKIVERHGGQISVESRPGEGAVFSFTLPKRQEAGRHERRAA